MIDGWCISCEIALIGMSLDFTEDKPTLFQVMAWWHQAKIHTSQRSKPVLACVDVKAWGLTSVILFTKITAPGVT